MNELTDNELLALAAKAVGGLVYVPDMGWIEQDAQGYRGAWWCPLENDGDEARLEAALGLNVRWLDKHVCVSLDSSGYFEPYSSHPDKQAARRRAGVRCAAEIGAAK